MRSRALSLGRASLAALACGALATCSPGGFRLGGAGPGIGVTNIRTGPGIKRVATKRPPSLLLAEDGTGCDVSPDRFRDTDVGDLFDCPDWRADPPKR